MNACRRTESFGNAQSTVVKDFCAFQGSTLSAKEKPLRIEDAQTPRRQGRPSHVAAQAFELLPVRAHDPYSCMQRKAARGKAQGRCTYLGGRILQGTSQALAGACPGGDGPSHRGRRQGGHHEFLIGEPISLSVVEQAVLVHRRMMRRALVCTICCTSGSDNGGTATKTGAFFPST